MLLIYLLGSFICFFGMLTIYASSEQWKQYEKEGGNKELLSDILVFVIGVFLSWALILVIIGAIIYYKLRDYIYKRK